MRVKFSSSTESRPAAREIAARSQDQIRLAGFEREGILPRPRLRTLEHGSILPGPQQLRFRNCKSSDVVCQRALITGSPGSLISSTQRQPSSSIRSAVAVSSITNGGDAITAHRNAVGSDGNICRRQERCKHVYRDRH